MSGMPTSTIVKVQATITGQQNIIEESPNQILFATTDQPTSTGVFPFKTYTNLDEVAIDWESNTSTYQHASKIFSQTPNILAGKGTLTIASFLPATVGSLDAKSAHSELGIITTAKINAFKLVSRGAMDIIVDGVLSQLRNLDFRKIVAIADICKVIQDALPYQIRCVSNTDKLNISTKTFGFVGSIGFLSPINLTAGETDITGTNYLDTPTSVDVAGVDVDDTTEDLQKLTERLNALPNRPTYFTIITNQLMHPALLKKNAEFIQSAKTSNYGPLMFAYASSTINSTNLDVNSVAKVIQELTTLGYSQTRMLISLNSSPEDALLLVSATVGKLCSVDFEIANSVSNCMISGKTLAGIEGDVVSVGVKDAIQTSGADAYYNISNYNQLFASGKNGGWFDNIYNQNFLMCKARTTMAQLLQTDSALLTSAAGELSVGSAAIQFCEKAITCGIFTSGYDWIGPLPNGIPQNKIDAFNEGIKTKGYFIYIPSFADNRTALQKRETPPVNIYGIVVGQIQTIFVYENLQTA